MHNLLVSVIFILLSSQMITSMMYQLIFLNHLNWITNCSFIISEANFTYKNPFNTDNLKYLGLSKYSNFRDYAWTVAINMTLCCIWYVIQYHQIQFYNRKQSSPPEPGIVFSDFSYNKMNDKLISGIKLLLNFAFYKIGLEICFIATVINAYLRLDVFSVIYLLLMLFFLSTSRLYCSKVWPLYLLILNILILYQYAICVGLPPILCQEYPYTFREQLEIWLFLPSYHNIPQASKLIGDMIQYMLVVLQYNVFIMEKSLQNSKGGNRPILINEIPNPSEKDFISNKNSYMDYLKQFIFCWCYWLSLAIVFLNGIMRNTLFCLGYMIFASIYFWIGQQFIISQRKYLLSSWNIILFYNFFTILIKCILQLVSCAYIDYIINYSNCWLVHILGIQCIEVNIPVINATETSGHCGPINNNFFWDVLCFIFIIIQRKIFTTKLFCFVVLDMKVTGKFTSRGAMLINRKLIAVVTEEKNRENELVAKIKEKIVKIEQCHQNYGRPLPNEHYLVLRSGDYFLFDENPENEDIDEEDEINNDSYDIFNYHYGDSIVDLVFSDKVKSNLSEPHDSVGEKKRLSKLNLQSRSAISFKNLENKTNAKAQNVPVVQKKKNMPKPLNENNKTFFKKDIVYQAQNVSQLTDTSDISNDIIENTSQGKKDNITNESGYWACGKSTTIAFYKFLLKCLDSLIIRINILTKDIRYVRAILENERRIIKRKIINYAHGDWMGIRHNTFYVYKNHGQTLEIKIKLNAFLTFTADHYKIPYRTVELETINIKLFVEKENITDQNSSNFSLVDETTKVQQFRKSSSRFFNLLVALGNLLIIYSDMFCYIILVLNHMISFNILSLVYPLTVFLWAMLSTPRPSTFYWMFIIQYTQLVILVKYIFQFNFIDIESGVNALERNSPFFLPVFLGIEKRKNYALVDLLQLFVLFLHRGYLKNHGLWKGFKEKFNQDRRNSTSTAKISTNSMSTRSPFLKPFIIVKRFYMKLTSYRYSRRVDVYVYMFLCEFFSFFIIVIGYETFGPGTGSTSTALDFLKTNKIPVPFILMLITQFIFIIIDRALFLRKHIMGKLCFQIFYVILIHVWIFFLNPFISKSKFNARLAPQLLYFFKCLYFALSSYQIRSGYPLRILGNFLTKKYNYMNLFLFKGYLIVPFLYELRSVMDWIWTDTALSLYHWMEVEDVFAKVFVLKCWRRSELEYPTPRGTNRWHVTKYLVGGLLMIFFFLCFWGPLTIGSFIGTIFVRNPPIHCQFRLEFDGVSNLYNYNSRESSLRSIVEEEYLYIKECFKHNETSLSFLKSFELHDLTILSINKFSESIWSISPPSLEIFKSHLSDAKYEILINFITTCERVPIDTKSTKTEVSYTFPRLLTNLEKLQFFYVLQNKRTLVFLKDAFPKFLVASKTDLIDVPVLMNSNISEFNSIHLFLKSNKNISWWEVYPDINKMCLSDKILSKLGLYIIIFSEKISDNLFGQLFSRYGIIGIYVSYIFVAHRLLRAVYSNISYIIRCEELPYVDRILKLLNEIYLVRENKMFRLEEQLVAKLIFVYRSDETMIKLTRHKQSILDKHMDK